MSHDYGKLLTNERKSKMNLGAYVYELQRNYEVF
jgi:hypothetical protein